MEYLPFFVSYLVPAVALGLRPERFFSAFAVVFTFVMPLGVVGFLLLILGALSDQPALAFLTLKEPYEEVVLSIVLCACYGLSSGSLVLAVRKLLGHIRTK